MPFYRQPIIHFLVLGIALFALFSWVNPDGEGDDTTIVVDNETLLEYLQYRNRAFNPQQSEGMLANLGPEERRNLVEQLVREEALYREALKMGLDDDDYVIKQRLIQKIEYLSQGYVPDSQDLDREKVEQYFADNRDRYEEPPSVTFTHVFVSGDGKPSDEAEAMADALLQRLQAENVGFAGAMTFGERFLYHRNYVERSGEFVASHFGDAFAGEVMSLEPGGAWHGPVQSDHGYHLVMVSARTPGGVPGLDDIYGRVAGDARQALLEQRQEETLREVIAQYKVIDKTAPVPADGDGDNALAAREQN